MIIKNILLIFHVGKFHKLFSQYKKAVSSIKRCLCLIELNQIGAFLLPFIAFNYFKKLFVIMCLESEPVC